MSDDLTDRPNAEEVIARELRRSGLSTALADADAPDYVSALMREGYGIWDIAALDAHTAGLVGDARQARSLLAEARDEITRLNERLRDSWYVDIGERLDAAEAENARLREGIERHRDGVGSTDTSIDADLWALLDAPPTETPVRDGTNTEQEQQ